METWKTGRRWSAPPGDTLQSAANSKGGAEEGKQSLTPNFLAAHGFKKEEGWSSLTPERPLVIIKLEDVAQEIGLKSP